MTEQLASAVLKTNNSAQKQYKPYYSLKVFLFNNLDNCTHNWINLGDNLGLIF